MEPTKEQRTDRHLRFFARNWLHIAAFAWDCHGKKGKGTVLICEEDIPHNPADMLGSFRMRYLSPTATNNPSLEGVLSEKEQGLLRDCDPRKQVFVSVLRGEHVRSYVFDGGLPPPEAWQMKQAEQN